MTEPKRCLSCGLPMEQAEDFAQGDVSKAYCRHCARADGALQSLAERTASLAEYVMHTQNLDQATAQQAALEMLKRQPIWQGLEEQNLHDGIH